MPEDISVVGFDDIPEAAYFWPGLTTVNQQFSVLGRHAVDLTVRAFGGERETSAGLIQPELVVRSPSGPATDRPGSRTLTFTSCA